MTLSLTPGWADDLDPINGRPDGAPDLVVEIVLPWQSPPLSMNDRGVSRGAMYAKANEVTNIRQSVMFLLRRHRVPTAARFVDVQLHYLPLDNRRRDTDNAIATLKPVCDAIAAGTKSHPGYGLVEDDTPAFMGKPEPIIYHHPKGQQPRMWLTLSIWEESNADG